MANKTCLLTYLLTYENLNLSTYKGNYFLVEMNLLKKFQNSIVKILKHVLQKKTSFCCNKIILKIISHQKFYTLGISPIFLKGHKAKVVKT